MDDSSEIASRSDVVSAPVTTPSTPEAAKAPPKIKAKAAGAKPKSTKRRSVDTESHSARVERVALELGDLLDEHDAELREIKDRVGHALARTSQLRKAMKSAIKDVSHNASLEAELAEFRKKFESLRSLMG
ncbi:MAG: hypothetical protein AAF658_00455 [Myxococcota bacterium]